MNDAPAATLNCSVWDLGSLAAPKLKIKNLFLALCRELRMEFGAACPEGRSAAPESAANLITLFRLYWVLMTAANQDSYSRASDYGQIITRYIPGADILPAPGEAEGPAIAAQLQRLREQIGLAGPRESVPLKPGDFPSMPSFSTALRINEPPARTVFTRFIHPDDR